MIKKLRRILNGISILHQLPEIRGNVDKISNDINNNNNSNNKNNQKISDIEEFISNIGNEPDTSAKKIELIEASIAQTIATLGELGLAPLPPRHLQERVVGGYSPRFVESGYELVQDVVRILTAVDRDMADFKDILDWGCGCGRVTRAFSNSYPGARMSGSDIDSEAISWLQEHYQKFGAFQTNPMAPPMAYSDDSFDLIVSVSVLTHLPEELQFEWLAEIRRLLRKDGIALLSVHGKNHFGTLTQEMRDQLRDHGFYYHADAGVTDGLPDIYKNSYHTEDYIRREWSNYFDILDIVPTGFGSHQDVVVLGHKESS